MNVLFVSLPSLGLHAGGVHRQVWETKRALEELGIEVSLYSPWEPVQDVGSDLVHLFEASIRTLPVARDIARAGFPLVVSPVFFRALPAWLMRLETAILNIIPTLYTSHAATAEILDTACGVLPNTSAEADLISRAFGVPRDRISIVPNAVDMRFGTAEPHLFVAKYGISDFVLSVGSGARKNFSRLIRATAGLDVPLVLIGRNSERDIWQPIERVARDYSHVHIIDSLDHDDPLLASAYAACKVFALPSEFETPGLAALEAGLAGASVVITEVGGTADYFGDHAYYVNPHSLSSVQRGIERALRESPSPLLSQHIERNFTWPRAATATLHAYQQLGVLAASDRSETRD